MSEPIDPRPECKVTGCDRPTRSLGWCSMHYGRIHRLGTISLPGGFPTAKARTPRRVAPGERSNDSLSSVPIGGTITMEEWRRLRATPAADVHVVQRQRNATGIVA